MQMAAEVVDELLDLARRLESIHAQHLNPSLISA